MDYLEFIHHKFIQSHGGCSPDEIPDTYDLWVKCLTEEQRMKFLMEWEGLATSPEARRAN